MRPRRAPVPARARRAAGVRRRARSTSARRARVALRSRPACRPRAVRRGTPARQRRRSGASRAVLELVPAWRRQQLEQRAPAARIAIRELLRFVVPADLELALLQVVVEPRAAEDELLQPVHERLAAHEGDLVPAADEVAAERAARLLDPGALDELDEIGRLVLVELVPREEPELHGGGGHALLEVLGVE